MLYVFTLSECGESSKSSLVLTLNIHLGLEHNLFSHAAYADLCMEHAHYQFHDPCYQSQCAPIENVHLKLAKLLDLGGTSPWEDTEDVEADLRAVLVILGCR